MGGGRVANYIPKFVWPSPAGEEWRVAPPGEESLLVLTFLLGVVGEVSLVPLLFGPAMMTKGRKLQYNKNINY